jgi:hypothetical protein
MPSLPFVIGAGVSRTGTTSLKAALETLGYHPFHTSELFHGQADTDSWFRLATAARKGDAVQNLTLQTAQLVLEQGYNATMDFPTALLLEEFLQLQPNAKVILSVRSNSSVWKESIVETMGKAFDVYSRPPFSMQSFFRQYTNELLPWFLERFGAVPPGKKIHPRDVSMEELDLERAYTNWIQHVKKVVPSKHLLIHKPQDGFAPICKHLKIAADACPTMEYPHLNSRDEYLNTMWTFELMTNLFWPVSWSFVLLLLVLVRFCITLQAQTKAARKAARNNATGRKGKSKVAAAKKKKR